MIQPYGTDVFEYKRGDEWSVICVMHNSGIITFDKLKHPSTASEDLIRRFCIEAESAIEIHEKDLNRKHYGGV